MPEKFPPLPESAEVLKSRTTTFRKNFFSLKGYATKFRLSYFSDKKEKPDLAQ
jgi:hypothetical protein